MKTSRKQSVYIIDSSAVLSGKPFYHQIDRFTTTPLIADEFSPGGRDYEIFQFIKQKGLIIQSPDEDIFKFVRSVAKKQGEISRLSDADCELLALAMQIKKKGEYHPVLITDDYAIQNMAELLGLDFQSVGQRRITKTFKWQSRCRGCGRIEEPGRKTCSVCGSPIVQVVQKKESVKKQKRDE